MEPVSLFDLAAQQARWLSVRQSAVAGNIANVNTPDYKAVDAKPFEHVLESSRLAIAPTHPDHIPIGTAPGAVDVREDADAVVSESGNSVSLEQEMVKAGELRRAFEMNTAIVKAFHRMMLMTTRT